MPTQSIPQMMAAHNRAVRMNRRAKRVGVAFSALVTLMGICAVTLGTATLTAHMVATAVHVATVGGAR